MQLPRRVRSSACRTRVDQVVPALTVAGEARLPAQRLTRAETVDALVALVEAPQRLAQRRVVPGHGRWHRKPAQLRGEGQYLLRRCRLVVGRQIQPIHARPLHRCDNDRCQVIHVQAVEHQPWTHYVARTSLCQLQQRIASRSVQSGQAEYRRGDTALLRQRTPLVLGAPALHAGRFSGIGHAGCVDPAAGPIGIDRRG